MKKTLLFSFIVLLIGGGLIWYFFFTVDEEFPTDQTITTETPNDSSYNPTLTSVEEPAMEDTATPPTISVTDQRIANGAITIRSVQSPMASWIVAYNDDGGKPGRIIGYAHVDAGTMQSVSLPMNASLATESMYLVVHKDAGIAGTFEFPGDDVALAVNGTVVTSRLKILQ